MICRNCGTDSPGVYCSHCGFKMNAEPFQPVQQAPISFVSIPVRAEEKAPPCESSEKKRPLRLKMVIWQAIVMLAPLAYLFFDLFVLFHEKLGEVGEKGKTNLALLFDYLTAAEYSDNFFDEIVRALFGDISLFQTISLGTLFSSGASEFILPVIVIVLMALLSAAMAVLLLVTCGRILHFRVAVDLCLLGGIGSTFAPLLGTFLLRFAYCFKGGFAAADAAMLRVTLSVEAILLMAFLACAMLPAMRSIARLGAYVRDEERHVVLPYRAAKPLSFVLIRALAAAAIGCSLLLVASYLLLPISSEGDLLAFSIAWKSFTTDLTALCKSIWGIIAGATSMPNLAALASMLIKFFFFLQIPFLATGFVAVLSTFIRIWRMRADTLCDRKNDRARLKKIGKRIRDIVLKPYVCFTVLQTLLVLLLLFASPMAARLDFTNIFNTLGAIYLTIAEVKGFCVTTTAYAFLALGGALLWHTADKLSAVMMQKADEK